jgi:diguanylate cyclase (GGDEF)-like protein
MEAGKKNSILIVDDDNTNIKVLTHILGGDYDILSASNGISAMGKAREYKPDLILLDILMPGMNGYETLVEMKKNDVIQKIPVIFITGLNSDEDEEKGLSLEAVDYITKPFSAKIVKLRVRNQIQIINQLHTIKDLSMLDQLTKLPNRRCFDERLRIEWKQAIVEKTPLSLIMLDLDKFKKLNDTYGHQQGDAALKTIAGIFPHAFRRPGDIAARWGGEEFVILLPNTPLADALETAEKVRTDIEDADIPRSGDLTPIKSTVSIGVNSLIPEMDSSIDMFISKTDKALYKAKEAGGNCIMQMKDIQTE